MLDNQQRQRHDVPDGQPYDDATNVQPDIDRPVSPKSVSRRALVVDSPVTVFLGTAVSLRRRPSEKKSTN